MFEVVPVAGYRQHSLGPTANYGLRVLAFLLGVLPSQHVLSSLNL
jgi:hypothetical protein